MEIEKLLKEYKIKFKEDTGIDLDNCTQKEYEEWFHQDCSDRAKTDTYIAAILESAENIIENKKYSTLIKILQNYDELVKEKIDQKDKQDLPYWQLCLFNNLQVSVD